jgi:C1A family cysteine protease
MEDKIFDEDQPITDDAPAGTNYGWIRDLPDQRDYTYLLPQQPFFLAPYYNMKDKMPPVYNQGKLGSCTAQAIAGALHYEWIQHKKPNPFIPSKLYIYYNERYLEGSINQDRGAMIRTGMKAINNWGFCKETLCPYIISKFAVRPTDEAYSDGGTRRVFQYARAQQDRNFLQTTLSGDQPVVFGFSVYESFNRVGSSGIVPMPAMSERQLGGHAVLLVGYDNSRQLYCFRNSYGSGWGDRGYGYLPFAYVENSNLAHDFWVVKSV